VSKKLTLEIATPKVALVEGVEVAGVEVPGALGEIGILPEHEAFCGPVAPGVARFAGDDGSRRVAVGTGYFEVTGEGLVRVLVDRAVTAEEVDPDAVRARLADVEASEDEGAARDAAFLRAQLRAKGVAEQA